MPIAKLITRLGLVAALMCAALVGVAVGVGQGMPITGEIVFYTFGRIYVMDVRTGIAYNFIWYDPIYEDPSLSQDGERLAFVSGEGKRAEIYILDLSTYKTRLLTTNNDIGGIVWSPNGNEIAFAAADTETGHFDIYVVDTDTGISHNLTNHFAIDVQPTWSPDGTQIAFASSSRDTDFWQLYLIDADGSNLKRLTYNDGAYNPAWSPNSRQIAFECGSEVCLINADTGEILPLVTQAISNYHPVWSPDGRWILFYAGGEGSYQGAYLASADITNQELLRVGETEEALWSPFSSQVLFPLAEGQIWQLYTINVDTNVLTHLASVSNFYPNLIAWRPQP